MRKTTKQDNTKTHKPLTKVYLRNTTWPACDLEVLGNVAVFQFLNEFHLVSVHGRFRGRLATGTGVFALRRHCLALEPTIATCSKAR